jgi:hypothetical protein
MSVVEIASLALAGLVLGVLGPIPGDKDALEHLLLSFQSANGH